MNTVTGTCSVCNTETTAPVEGLTIIVGLNGDAEYGFACAVCDEVRQQMWTGIDTTTKLVFAQRAGARIVCVASVRRAVSDIVEVDFPSDRHGEITTTTDALWHEIDLWERAANPPAASA